MLGARREICTPRVCTEWCLFESLFLHFPSFSYIIFLCSIWINKYIIISQRTNSNISDAQCSQKLKSNLIRNHSKPWVDFQNHSEASDFLSEDTPSTSSLPKGTSSNITFDSSITQASDGCGVLGGATGVMSTPLLAWIWGDSNGEGISSVFFIPCNGCLPKGGGSIHVRPMQQMQLDL